MKISEHADRSEARTGLRAEDIHQWIDSFFDRESYEEYLRNGRRPEYDPYTHRKYRHCAEALEDAFREFEGRYTREEIQAVFECHIRDDYNGYLPSRHDFETGTFAEKYHEPEAGGDLKAILSENELADYFRNQSYRNRPRPRISAAFYWRIVWPTVIAAALFVASSFTIIVPIFRQNMMNQKKTMIRELTQTAASAIMFYVHQAESGQMPREKAQAEAAKELSELRYGEDGKDYFWITDMQPVMIMHPYRPELAGRDLTNYTDHEDKSGKRLFVEFVELVRQKGHGYLEYLWQWKDDPDRTAPKLSYVMGVPEWNWIIGTGIYIHDIEAEMKRLSRKLMVADGVIALTLFALLGNLLFQSRKIEQERSQAESGLREAKDRYRALAEASGEGSLLEVNGQTVYSNQALRELTGYSESELSGMPLESLLADDPETNAIALAHFSEIARGESVGAEFEAVLKTRTGRPVHVWVTVNRIFFSEKKGHVIHFSTLSRSQEETLRGFHSPVALSSDVSALDGLNRKIKECETPGQVIQALKDFPMKIRVLTDQGMRPELLRHIIGMTFDLTLKQIVTLLPEKEALPEVPFAVLSLGSSARHEMTLFSDQDNAIIFDDVPPERLAETRRSFLQLGDRLCARLKQAGWPYCPGGIMAANPKWCLSLSEWKKHFDHWILDANPQDILEVNVFLDIRCGFGDARLVGKLKEYVFGLARKNPEFLMHYARNCLQYKAPLTLFGHLKTRQSEGRRTVNIKQSIKPIETFARIYALKNGLQETGTCERIRRLGQQELLQEETVREMDYVFNQLWQIRFSNQLMPNDGLPAVHDDLDIETLTDIERRNLKELLAKIAGFQTRLSYDFLGVSSS